MQSFDGRPTEWSEEEKIHLALHIFQQRERRYGSRSSAAQVLFEHLASYQPDWDDLPLPAGRTVAQGRLVFGSYSRQSSAPSAAHSAGPSPGSYGFPLMGGMTGGVTSRKRSAPSDALTPQIGRPLAPKQPSAFGPEPSIRASITGHQPISPMVEPSPRLDEPRKKRGRPTKQEAEERRRKMEARQQLRLQAQAPSQVTQSGQAVQPSAAYAAQFGQPAQPVPTGLASQLHGEDTPASSSAPQHPATSQTPRRQSIDEPNSSGSSGKKRRTRPPRLSVSETEPPPPPFYPTPTNLPGPAAHGSPPHTGSHREGRQPHSSRSSIYPASFTPAEPDMTSYDPNEENRPQNPRSRPWEVSDRPGM